MKGLDARIDFLWAIATNQGKEAVKKRFIKYCEAYDELEREPTVREKIRHREMFEKYTKYMSSGERE